MNLTGRCNGFFPIDHDQEHNIRDIKVTHQVQGPNMSWDLMKCISPMIPTLVWICKHMERQIQTLRWGSYHWSCKNKRYWVTGRCIPHIRDPRATRWTSCERKSRPSGGCCFIRGGTPIFMEDNAMVVGAPGLCIFYIRAMGVWVVLIDGWCVH